MSIEKQKTEALKFLGAIEDAEISVDEAFAVAENLEPVLVYFLLRYLREKYSPKNPDAAAVVKRLVNLMSSHDKILQISKQGEDDPLKDWFNDSYNMREYFGKRDEFIDLIIDKIEG